MAEFGSTMNNLCRANVDLAPRAICILLHLYKATSNEDSTAGAVIKALGIPPASGSRHGMCLEKAGYITRAFFPDDNRRTLYRITAKGSALCQRIEGGFPEQENAA